MNQKRIITDGKDNREWQLALEFIEDTGSHIFLTGKAGTGKTTFLKELTKHSAKQMVVTAPTGVAAINAGGVTLHSFFQLPLGPFIPGSDAFLKNKKALFRFSKEKKQIIQRLDLLVIDEISMVRADVIDAVDSVLKYHRRNSMAFGGVQVLFIGDMHQLPPVVRPDEWSLLNQYYDSFYFFDGLVIKGLDLLTIELKKIYRQSDDAFIGLLNRVRESRLDPETIELLNQKLDPGTSSADQEGVIVLTTHNKKADNINQDKLDAINQPCCDLDADISGDFPQTAFPTAAQLRLKKGAQVMFLRNDPSPDKLYYNGKIGEISHISDQKILVKCPGESEEVSLTPAEWENVKYTLDQENQEIRQEVVGTFKQFPLKPAWAITIHKSQGLTFDRAVIDAEDAFAQGQFYVALSRCKSLEGLIFSSSVPLKEFAMDDAVTRFLKTVSDTACLDRRLASGKIAWQQELLLSCFDFGELAKWFYSLKRLLTNNTGLVQVSGIRDLDGLWPAAQKNIFSVSEKFKTQLKNNFPKDMLPVPDAYIQERTQKASAWFRQQLTDILGGLAEQFHAETDNKELAKKIKFSLDRLHLEIAVKSAAMDSCRVTFSPDEYLRATAAAATSFSPARPAKSSQPVYSESDIAHPELFRQLKEWRLKTAREKNIPAFQILHQQVLIQIVVSLPDNASDLEKIKGVGKKTMKNYGEQILDMIRVYREANKATL